MGSVKTAILITLATSTLFMGGCCDSCGKQMAQILKTAYLLFAERAQACCARSLTPEETSACVRERQETLDEALALALAAHVACNQGDQELMRRIIGQIVNRILGPNSPILPGNPSAPMSRADGSMYNPLPLFGCGDSLGLNGFALPDNEWKPKTTAIVNGQEVLPEAAGKAAVKDRETGRVHGAATTHILLESEPQASKFAGYTIAENSELRFGDGLLSETFRFGGSFSISAFKQLANGDVISIPGDAEFTLTGTDGSIVVSLDKAQPANRIVVGPDNLGRFEASFVVRGTEDFDFLPALYEKVWLQIPIAIDANDLSIDFGALGAVAGCDLAPYANPVSPVGPAQDGFPQACDPIDTDGDGVDDTTRIRYQFQQAADNLFEQLCND